MMVWRYRTILFEFSKDGLLGDKYIDDEEVEKSLNELGSRSWELVNVSLIQEGLLAILKRPLEERSSAVSSSTVPSAEPVVAANSAPAYVPLALSPRKETTIAGDLPGRQESDGHHGRSNPAAVQREERDFVGGIRIS
ncbi:DUF4177 domain-containing protein [Desulfobulbus alkaliphilus]|uniref:DUF4177 domain-containing protein n=1 Tax=Desulfobulbus alkaliphilus TaxID=869814 RepID=UPI0019644631|nr:DUF4177 domain-containing protein [Desulfobulbus alkaliphilus]MBM9535481.1 DUF4177 domain-containing protein [Desulfobulbus alkaliphilus]